MKFPSTGRRVAVIGDMLELGVHAEALHSQVGKRIATLAPDLLVTVGALASGAGVAAQDAGLPAASHVHFDTAKDCAQAKASWCRHDDTVLVKGSRGIALEHVVLALSNRLSGVPKEES